MLVLTYHDHVPPGHVRGADLEKAQWKLEYEVIHTLEDMNQEVRVLGVNEDLAVIPKAIADFKPHIAFNLLDEFQGKAALDHNVISYLELLGLPYTGCNARGLILSRDKALTKKLLAYHKIQVPEFMVFPQSRKVRLPASMAYPLFVKSLIEDGSQGISQSCIVYDEKHLEERVSFIHQNVGTDAIVETYIEGRELYVGVVGNSRLEVLPVWELFFNKTPDEVHRIATARVKWNPTYRKKYGIKTGEAKGLDSTLEQKIQEICREAYRINGISGYARMDLRLTKDNQVYFIEANPNPHIGKDEELAESARASGKSYEELLWKILRLGLNWESGQLQVA